MLLQELKVKKKKGGEGLREEGMVIFLELRPPPWFQVLEQGTKGETTPGLWLPADGVPEWANTLGVLMHSKWGSNFADLANQSAI